MAGALGVIGLMQVEVESQDDQVGNVSGILVIGQGSGWHDGVDDGEGGGFFLFNWRVLDPAGFELLGELNVQSYAGLGFGGLSRG